MEEGVHLREYSDTLTTGASRPPIYYSRAYDEW